MGSFCDWTTTGGGVRVFVDNPCLCREDLTEMPERSEPTVRIPPVVAPLLTGPLSNVDLTKGLLASFANLSKSVGGSAVTAAALAGMTQPVTRVGGSNRASPRAADRRRSSRVGSEHRWEADCEPVSVPVANRNFDRAHREDVPRCGKRNQGERRVCDQL